MKSHKFMTWVLAAFAIVACVPIAAAQQLNSLVILPGTQSQYSSQVRLAPNWLDARVLAASTAESHTVPTGARWVLFSSTCNFYANAFRTATVPAADVTDGTGSELNPAGYLLTGVTAISFIAPTTCTITLAFYL